jgi:hypothetical protein
MADRTESRRLFPLDWERYTLIDEVLYRSGGQSPGDGSLQRLIALDPTAVPRVRDVPRGEYRPTLVWPEATILGHRALIFEVEDDGAVVFALEKVPRTWPRDRPLERWGMPERAGDGYWIGRADPSELSDIDDGVPDEWRPSLPAPE